MPQIADLNAQSRLLITHDEEIVHIGRLHYLYGAKWLSFAALAFTGAALLAFTTAAGTLTFNNPTILGLLFLLLATSIGCWVAYRFPFWRSFFVITNQRALVGIGQYTIVQEQILPHQLEDWEIRENYLESLLGFGHLTLRIIEGRQLRVIQIPYLKEPHKFTHYLDEISPIRARERKVGFDTDDLPAKRKQATYEERLPHFSEAPATPAPAKPEKIVHFQRK